MNDEANENTKYGRICAESTMIEFQITNYKTKKYKKYKIEDRIMLEIFPAIDLKDGKAVRLYKGKISSAKVYGNAVDFAKKFQGMGARWLHIVDLDGALSGEPKNFAEIELIRKSCNLKIQLGGGIRNEETIKRYVDLGIDRLILGSIAMRNPTFAKEMAQKYRIAVGIDVKEGKVAVEGWAETKQVRALKLAQEFQNTAIDALICTDIDRDGALSGINVKFTLQMAEASKCFCIASGGFKDETDLINLNKIFIEHKLVGGIIIGKAYYEGKVNLESFLKKI